MPIKDQADLLIKKLEMSERTRFSIEALHTMLLQQGVMYPWLRKETIKYLVAIGKLERMSDSMFKLTAKDESETDVNGELS